MENLDNLELITKDFKKVVTKNNIKGNKKATKKVSKIKYIIIGTLITLFIVSIKDYTYNIMKLEIYQNTYNNSSCKSNINGYNVDYCNELQNTINHIERELGRKETKLIK